MDVPQMSQSFADAGIEVEVQSFSDVRLDRRYEGTAVLYTSSEDCGLLYKSYIEDIVLSLEGLGARTIPSYTYLRAHHNKCMMEALRYQLFPESASVLDSRCYGTFEELAAADLGDRWPKVLKSAYGAGSNSVVKAENREQLLKFARRLSRTYSLGDTIREYRRRILWKGYHKRSLNRNKLIIQNLVPELEGDYKVLRYGTRFYVLYRRNRPNDFRASGSGLFTFDLPGRPDVDDLLEYSRRAAETIGTPIVSLDIGFDGENFHLLEFQCLNFGTLTAEESPHYYTRTDSGWTAVPERCNLESGFCESILDHLQQGSFT
ncbi:hypothetical protein [Krasilnikovia sp. M28-CT-15]|uniref:hypothetical protein n=1 Tax=Krasilnikovia sp. M28-CT-15 TaxID=3373540 RepID=UPI00399D1CDF